MKPVPPSFGLALTECPGGVVLNWSKYGGAGFARYVTLRATNPNIPKAYPPAAGVTAMAGTTVRTKTSGADGSVADGKTYFYRTLALGPADKVLAASAVESGLGFGQKDLGPLSVTSTSDIISWGPYHNPACFSEYRLLYWTDATSGSPSPEIVTPYTQSNVPIPPSTGWISGQTIYFRIQVLRVTAVDTFVVGQTTDPPATYIYP